MVLSLSDTLLALTVGFLVLHFLMDVRSMVLAVRHPKDLALTTATVVVFLGHIITAHMGLG